jgi:hypothetical protein
MASSFVKGVIQLGPDYRRVTIKKTCDDRLVKNRSRAIMGSKTSWRAAYIESSYV